MSRDDWFRRSSWTDEDRSDFHARLRRARKRNRPQYLRIQACHLAREDNHPAALELLDEYLDIEEEEIDLAQAHVQRAESLIETGDHQEAITAFRHALDAERHRPNVQTEAWLLFPWFIVEYERQDPYEEAAAILAEFFGTRELTFPMSEYRFFAVKALLSAHDGDTEFARSFAQKAIAATSAKDSGFRYHPDVGLVNDTNTAVHKRLTEMVAK
jgi:tetratricopeptide (TPR) repeat protein